MNDLSVKSMLGPLRSIRPRSGAMVWAAGLVLGASSLSGCADFRRAVFLPPVNPESPVAAQVAIGVRRNVQTPAFTNVPPAPKNVPTAPMVKTAVFTMVGCRRTFERYDREHPPMVGDTAQFAAQERTKVDLDPADIPTPAQDKASQAYADQMKAYASPPTALASGRAPSASDVNAPPPKAATLSASPAPVAATAAKPVSRSVKTATVHTKPVTPAAIAAAPPAAAPTPVASTPAEAMTIAMAPPPPPAAADPLLSHCH